MVHDAWNRLEKDTNGFEDSCWPIFLFFWLKLDEYTTAMRGECGKQDYLWMIDKHLCQRMTDKHDHLHMTAKHDHSGQTLTNNNSVTLSAYIMIISFRPLSLVKYRGPPKQTMTSCLLQQWGWPTRPDQLTEQIILSYIPSLTCLPGMETKLWKITNANENQ